MKLRAYKDRDWQKVADLCNRCFAGRYRVLPHATLGGLLRDRLNWRMDRSSASAAWVTVDGPEIQGFVSAHAGNSGSGVITTPLFEGADVRTGDVLLQSAEAFLREKSVEGANVLGVSREYNVGFGEPRHMWLLNRGYASYKYRGEDGLELAMEIDLSGFCVTPEIQRLRATHDAGGFTFELLQEGHVEGLKKLAFADWMLRALKRPISTDPTRYPYLICREADHVVGFCGGCGVDDKHGSGGFSFILLQDQYRGRGMGAVMLSLTLEWLKSQGATFQVLFTGVENRTQRLYKRAGHEYCFISATDVSKRLGRH